MWAGDLIEKAGNLVDMVAVHMMNQRATESEPMLVGREYMKDRAAAWGQLQNIYRRVDEKLAEIVSVVRASESDVKIAITEGHLSLRPHNTNLMLYEWIAGLYNARLMNLFERHADLVEISTLADFFGNRWTVNAVMLGSPRQSVFLMPVATIMKIFNRYSGDQGIRVPSQLGSLDLSASRNASTVFLHVVNCGPGSAETAAIKVAGAPNGSVTIREIAPGDLGAYVDHDRTDTFEPVTRTGEIRDGVFSWQFPAASVSVVEIPV